MNPLQRRLLGSGLLVLAMLLSGAANAAKIACVGDSITYGSGLGDRGSEAYPSVLQRLLGEEHTVENFGVSGATLLEDGDRPYVEQSRYDASNKFAPDVVVVMLGTNDSKSKNWSKRDQFSGDYLALIEHYRQLGATVYVAKPPTVFKSGKFGITPPVMAEVTALVVQVAEQANAHLIDVTGATSGKGDLFPDTVHPNAEGAVIIAETVAASLMQHGFDSSEPMGVGGGTNAAGGSAAGGNAAGGGAAGGQPNAAGAGGSPNTHQGAGAGGTAASTAAGTSGTVAGGGGGAPTAEAPADEETTAAGAVANGGNNAMGATAPPNHTDGKDMTNVAPTEPPATPGAPAGTGGVAAPASPGPSQTATGNVSVNTTASPPNTSNDATPSPAAKDSSCSAVTTSGPASWTWLLLGMLLLRRRHPTSTSN